MLPTYIIFIVRSHMNKNIFGNFIYFRIRTSGIYKKKKKKNKSRYKRVAARSSLEKREYIIINLNVSRVILFVPGRRERKNGPGLSDNSADLSPFTTVSRDYRVPIRSRPGGEKRRKKKVHRRTYTYIREHSHPGSDRNGLNAREAPEECRCAYTSRDDLFVLASVVRSACETQKRIFYGEISLSLSVCLFLSISFYIVRLLYTSRIDIHKCHSGPARDSDRLTLRLISLVTLLSARSLMKIV